MPKYYLPFIYALPYNIQQNVLHNFTVITLNSTDFTTYLNRAVCFFHMFDWLFL